ncbi:hypothetical protein [Streptomyces sp. NPDC047024]|uniref:hypothetical protein n=1 Tax=Streptomyces sp. NPDC047024 TaxID=3155476 RepID=UPI0034088761
MTEATPLAKAEAAVTEASENTAAVQLALAAVELAKTVAAQQQTAPTQGCQHQHKQGRGAGEWVAIGGAVCVGGVGIAFASIAIAICGISVAVLALILRTIWQDVQAGRGR